MKKIYGILFAPLLAFAEPSTQSYGIIGGANVSKVAFEFDDPDNFEGTGSSYATAPLMGLLIVRPGPQSVVGFQSGLIIDIRSYDFWDDGEYQDPDIFTVKAIYLDVPLLLSLKTPNFGPGRPRLFVNGGIDVAFNLSASLESRDEGDLGKADVAFIDFGPRVEGGLLLPVGSNATNLMLGVGYTHSFTNHSGVEGTGIEGRYRTWRFFGGILF